MKSRIIFGDFKERSKNKLLTENPNHQREGMYETTITKSQTKFMNIVIILPTFVRFLSVIGNQKRLMTGKDISMEKTTKVENRKFPGQL